MSVIHITTAGVPVRLSAQHAKLLHPDDAAQQAKFRALAAAGQDDDVRSIVRHAARMAKLHMDNVEVALMPDERCETMVRGSTMMRTSACE